jgi:hypothetical protein
MESDPTLHIRINDKRVEMTRRNSSIWQFVGHLAMYNHIFIIDEEENNYGYYWADRAKEGQYNKYVQFMVDRSYPLHINLSDICDTDRQAYERYHPSPNIIHFPKAFEGLLGHE